jgi:acetolactate synthase-1/2/3 large subunit
LTWPVRETLSVLLDHCLANRLNFRAEDARERIAALKAAWRRDFAPLANSDAVPIKPERLLREISDRVRAETLIVADASYVTGWAYSHIDCVAQGCTIISPRGTGGLSWALPAAIGAKLGDPARNVVCLTGDGGFGYVLSELETAARYQVDLTIVVFNNATLGFQKHFERKLFGTYRECDFLDIDYAEVARAFKCRGERVTEPGAIGAALERAMASGGPALIDVAIDPESKAPVVPLEDDDAIEDTLEAVTQ